MEVQDQQTTTSANYYISSVETGADLWEVGFFTSPLHATLVRPLAGQFIVANFDQRRKLVLHPDLIAGPRTIKRRKPKTLEQLFCTDAPPPVPE